MPLHDDEPFEDLRVRSYEAKQCDRSLDQLRAGDATSAEASTLHPADMNEWRGSR